jgi:hypothetical protein
MGEEESRIQGRNQDMGDYRIPEGRPKNSPELRAHPDAPILEQHSRNQREEGIDHGLRGWARIRGEGWPFECVPEHHAEPQRACTWMERHSASLRLCVRMRLRKTLAKPSETMICGVVWAEIFSPCGDFGDSSTALPTSLLEFSHFEGFMLVRGISRGTTDPENRRLQGNRQREEEAPRHREPQVEAVSGYSARICTEHGQSRHGKGPPQQHPRTGPPCHVGSQDCHEAEEIQARHGQAQTQGNRPLRASPEAHGDCRESIHEKLEHD